MVRTAILGLALLSSLGAAPLAPAQNPLSRTTPAASPFAGRFASAEVVLELQAGAAAGDFTGTLTVHDRRFPCTATATGASLRGAFTADGGRYEFTATLARDVLTLRSDDATWELARQAQNPLGRRPGPRADEQRDEQRDGQRDVQRNGPPAADVGSVGIAFDQNEDGEIVVKAILPGGPAGKTGLKPGGVLLAIDGKEIAEDVTPEQLRAMVQGPIGSLVTLTIDTPDEVLDVVIQRAAIPANAPPPPGVGRPQANDGSRANDGAPTADGLQHDPRRLPAEPAATGFPSFLRAGARLTYWAGSATIPGTSSVLVLDDKGEWVDGNGRRYSSQSTNGTGGMGCQQLNVVHAGGNEIAVEMRNYVADGATQNVSLSWFGAYVGTARSLGDYWVDPAQLQALQPGQQGGTRIVRGTYDLDGRSYRTVAVRTTTGSGFTQFVYDLDSGLCLTSSTSATGANVMVANGDSSTIGAGGSTITHVRLVSVRQLELPWAGEPLPPSLREGRQLDYRGTYGVEIPGSPVVPIPMLASFRCERVGDGYVTGTLQTRVDGGYGMAQDGKEQRLFGAGMIGGLWVSPRALQQLQPNQRIDEDPVTRVQTFVAGSQNGLVVIVERGPTQELQYGYDPRSGMLVAVSQRLQNGIGTTVTQLQLANGR